MQLDKHMSRKHMDLLNHSASTCLEDYCDILECDHDRSSNGPPPGCDAAEMKLLQHKCNDTLLPKRMCRVDIWLTVHHLTRVFCAYCLRAAVRAAAAAAACMILR